MEKLWKGEARNLKVFIFIRKSPIIARSVSRWWMVHHLQGSILGSPLPRPLLCKGGPPRAPRAWPWSCYSWARLGWSPRTTQWNLFSLGMAKLEKGYFDSPPKCTRCHKTWRTLLQGARALRLLCMMSILSALHNSWPGLRSMKEGEKRYIWCQEDFLFDLLFVTFLWITELNVNGGIENMLEKEMVQYDIFIHTHVYVHIPT